MTAGADDTGGDQDLNAVADRLGVALEAGMGIFDWNIHTDQAFCTDSYFRLFGLSSRPGLLSEAEWLERVHPEDRERAAREIRRAFEGKPYDTEYRVVWPDGTVRWLSDKAKVFFDEAGNPYRMIGVIVDVTDRRQAVAALQQGEVLLFSILDSLPVGVFVVEADGKSYYANQVAREILGKGIVRGVTARDLPETYSAYLAGTSEVYPPDRQPIVEALQGRQGHADDLEIHRPDRKVPIEVWATPVHDADDRLVFAVAAFQDITERRQHDERIAALNEELATRVAELQAVNKELETFSYSVSHDLRAPLRAIDGFSRILLEDYSRCLDGEGQRLLGVVRKNVARMAELIDDLLQFSRLSRKAMDEVKLETDALVRQAVWEQTQASGRSNAEITIGTLPDTTGDPALLRHVWANYIGNALKYSAMRSPPKIEISGQRSRAEVVYAVRDNGIGFDMEYADNIFGVFERLHAHDEFEGTGVGLAIVQRIVHRHGGRVWAEARPDDGATFYFSLPVSEERERVAR